MDNTLAVLTPRGGLLPSGEESRLETITVTGGDRYAIKFDDTNNQQAIWTIPIVPGIYTGNGTLTLVVNCMMQSATTGVVNLSAEVESDSGVINLSGTNSFDSANTKLSSTVPGTAGQLFSVSIPLVFKDNLNPFYQMRIRLKRLASGNTATGNLRVLGAAVIEYNGWAEYASIFGDGSDCTDTITGTTTLTRSMCYNNLTINNGGILITNGYKVHVRQTLTIDSGGTLRSTALNVDGGNASGATAGSAGAAANGGEFGAGSAGGAGVAGKTTSSAGNNGNNGAASVSAYAASAPGGDGGLAGSGGSGGGSGAIGAAAITGGTHAPVRTIWDTWYALISGVLTPISGGRSGGGSGAGAGCTGSGNGGGSGGGGGSGNVLWLAARTILNSGTISAKGGNGGNGGNASGTDNHGGGGGGGGGGGVAIIITEVTQSLGTITAAGGTGGSGGTSGGGTGVNGASGSNGTNGYVLTFDTISQQYI